MTSVYLVLRALTRGSNLPGSPGRNHVEPVSADGWTLNLFRALQRFTRKQPCVRAEKINERSIIIARSIFAFVRPPSGITDANDSLEFARKCERFVEISYERWRVKVTITRIVSAFAQTNA